MIRSRASWKAGWPTSRSSATRTRRAGFTTRFSTARASLARSDAFREAMDVIDGWLAHRAPAGYLTRIERGELFVVEREGSIVGFGEATPGVVVACYVDPAFVRRGVGSVIMAHALALARRG